MAEKTFKYTAKIKQPQKVANIRLEPSGGIITERELKALRKDAYGASLIENGMLVVAETEAKTESEPAPAASNNADNGEEIPDFENVEKWENGIDKD